MLALMQKFETSAFLLFQCYSDMEADMLVKWKEHEHSQLAEEMPDDISIRAARNLGIATRIYGER